MKTVMLVFGTRPEAIKMCQLFLYNINGFACKKIADILEAN